MSKKFLFLSLVIGLAACSSDSKEMTVAEFTQKISQRECANVVAACLVPETACLSTRQAYWSQVASEAVMAGRPFDPSNADGCLAKVKSVFSALEKGLAIQGAEYREMNQTCRHAFHGPALEFQPCLTDLDCVDDLFCDKGSCGKPNEVGPGKQCANIGDYCSQGYICTPVGVTRQCVARAAKGAVCSDDGSCLEALRCSGGLCVDGLAIGLDCQADEDCASGFCEPYAKKCGNDIRFAAGSPACLAYQAPTVIAPVVVAPVVTPDASVD